MGNESQLDIKISGMHCASCVASIEKGLSTLPGVSACSVNLATHSGRVTFDATKSAQEVIIAKVRELGFEASESDGDLFSAADQAQQDATRAFTMSLIIGVPLMMVAMWPMVASGPLVSPSIDGILQLAAALAILLIPGRPILADGWKQTLHARANMNSLISLGTVAAFIWSTVELTRISFDQTAGHLYYDSVGMIISLILLGRLLEARSKGKAGNAVRALLALRPDRTTALINGIDIEIESGAIKSGMTLMIKPGERIPADGTIEDGRPAIDESMLTGESLPVEKHIGDAVISGSLNGNASFRMTVTRAGDDSYLASVVRMVTDAQSRKAPIQKLADRVAGYFTPVVLTIAILTGLFWWWAGATSADIMARAVAVLIIACPCALGLATPTAVLASSGRAASRGMIIRGGDVLQSLTTIDTLIFDKTGTLTHGSLELIDVVPTGELAEADLISIVGGAELMSEHPLGAAIVRYMKSQGLSPKTAKHVEAKPGFGLLAEYDGRKLAVGNRSLMEECEVEVEPHLELARTHMDRGHTVVFVSLETRILGMITLSDRIRSDAKEAVSVLKQSMERVMMLSGDSYRTAAGVAATIGIEQFEAGVRPEQKQQIIDSCQQLSYRVAMVGDGINDAPALASANIGIAIGSGADVAIEAADVVLVKPELAGLVSLFTLADSTMRTIRQNLFWAFFYNVAAIPVAAGLFIPLVGLSLSPSLAAGAMALSSLFVVTNSLRLSRLQI